ncbi:RNA polymerase sigma factor [Hyunsoonleella ulvae]|uniref:RNA polymerase sigma factor n=1 Tax=Hyunsoonleella ulvae TaxID=2799948 RepID=UPI00193AA8C3|nr:RNA polymerase sigma-70 factor [Hyunsoonleella ulvae]
MTGKEKHNEKVLIQELVQGNEEAFRKLFDAYRDDLYKYSLSMVCSEVYAKDIVQDVFLKVWTKRYTLNPELSFKAYIFTITRNKNIKFLKKAANNLKLREEVFYRGQKFLNSTDRYMREADLEVLKQNALGQLPPKRRLIFEMSRNDGKSYEDISQELGISPNTVRNQMSRALETLRSFILSDKDITLGLLLLISGWI